MTEAIDGYKDKFESVAIAEPMLGEVGDDATVINDDKKAVAQAITDEACKEAGFDDMKAAADAAEITPDMENADISAAMSEAMLSVELDGLTGKAKWTEDGECDKEPKAFEIQDGAYVEMD